MVRPKRSERIHQQHIDELTERRSIRVDQNLGAKKIRLITPPASPEEQGILLDLERMIGARLPNMQKRHVRKELKKEGHESFVLLAEDGSVFGGLTFMPLMKDIVEIVFLVTHPSGNGQGTRLMMELKDHIRKKGCIKIVTHADENAVEFFTKMGYVSLKDEAILDKMEKYDKAVPMVYQL